MKGLTRKRCGLITCLALLQVWVSADDQGDRLCATLGKPLIASNKLKTESFVWSRQLHLDKNNSCFKWIIRSSLNGGKIMLSFPVLNLINTTKSDSRDYIKIYDGDGEDSATETLYGRVHNWTFTSRHNNLEMMFIRGDAEGNRSFNMTYVSDSAQKVSTQEPPRTRTTVRTDRPMTSSTTKSNVPSTLPYSIQTSPKSIKTSLSSQTSPERPVKTAGTQRTVELAGIVTGVLAICSLTFVVLKVTKCCRCLWKKDTSSSSHVGSSLRERVRLADVAHQDGRNVHSNNQGDSSQPLSTNNNNAAPLASQEVETNVEQGHESDSDSQQDFNEPPPSYESLYLNEQGQPVAPPVYSPPKHHSSHPPRRVNTFN